MKFIVPIIVLGIIRGHKTKRIFKKSPKMMEEPRIEIVR